MMKPDQVVAVEDTPDIFKIKKDDSYIYSHARGSQTRGSQRSEAYPQAAILPSTFSQGGAGNNFSSTFGASFKDPNHPSNFAIPNSSMQSELQFSEQDGATLHLSS